MSVCYLPQVCLSVTAPVVTPLLTDTWFQSHLHLLLYRLQFSSLSVFLSVMKFFFLTVASSRSPCSVSSGRSHSSCASSSVTSMHESSKVCFTISRIYGIAFHLNHGSTRRGESHGPTARSCRRPQHSLRHYGVRSQTVRRQSVRDPKRKLQYPERGLHVAPSL